MRPVIDALNEAAKSLSYYLVAPGDARNAIRGARIWIEAAEQHLESPMLKRPPPPPPPPPPARCVHEDRMDCNCKFRGNDK
jgi:hypothetical protein